MYERNPAEVDRLTSDLIESLICLCQTRARDAAAEIKAHTNGP
jgi:hypothetical protein